MRRQALQNLPVAEWHLEQSVLPGKDTTTRRLTQAIDIETGREEDMPKLLPRD